jgi:hypothetical protein
VELKATHADALRYVNHEEVDGTSSRDGDPFSGSMSRASLRLLRSTDADLATIAFESLRLHGEIKVSTSSNS